MNDLSGRTFGLLTVISRSGTYVYPSGNRSVLWRCRCQCGVEVDASAKSLVGARRKYCDRSRHLDAWRPSDPVLSLHRASLTFVSWQCMMGRCKYPSTVNWMAYGGRGIAVCDRWQDFGAFLADMGERPSADYSIERRDVNGNYEPGNCYWATRIEQGANLRRTVWVEWRGERRKLQGLCRELVADGYIVRGRLKAGWDIEDAVSTPVHVKAPVPPPKPRRADRRDVERLLLGGSSVKAALELGFKPGLVGDVSRQIRRAMVPNPELSWPMSASDSAVPDKPKVGRPRGVKREEAVRLLRLGHSWQSLISQGIPRHTVYEARVELRRRGKRDTSVEG